MTSLSLADVSADETALPASHGEAGAALRSAREQQGLSLEAVAERTRISARYLSAIENCHFDEFIAPVFAVGFAKSFARTVGVCEDRVAREVREEIRLNPRPRPSELLPDRAGRPVLLRWLRLA